MYSNISIHTVTHTSARAPPPDAMLPLLLLPGLSAADETVDVAVDASGGQAAQPQPAGAVPDFAKLMASLGGGAAADGAAPDFNELLAAMGGGAADGGTPDLGNLLKGLGSSVPRIEPSSAHRAELALCMWQDRRAAQGRR